MPAIGGHELPTPGNADSAQQKKHREQIIAAGTLLLVVLTLILVVRKGSNKMPDAGNSADVTSDPNAFTPSESGGSAGDGGLGTLSQQIGALPGQIAAILPRQTVLAPPTALRHHHAPVAPIHVSVHTPIHTSGKRVVAHPHAKRGAHPAQHGRRLPVLPPRKAS